MNGVAGHDDWPARVRRLEEEVAGLRRAMRTRGLIEQAKGMLAERMGCDPETAFSFLSTRSQETNVPLVRIAADLVGALPTELPQPEQPARRTPAPLRLSESAEAPRLHTITELDGLDSPPGLSAAATRNLRLATAAMNAAGGLDELTRAMITVGLKDQPDAAVALFIAEPDGALRMLSCHGWPAQAVSEWRRLPSSIDTAVGHAVRTGNPVLLDGRTKHDFVVIGPPGDVRLVFPIAIGDRTVGGWHFAWPQARRLGPAMRLYLAHLATAGARALTRLWPAALAEHAVASTADLDWVRSVLEAIHGGAHLLSPVRAEDGGVVDFTIEAVSTEAGRTDRAVLGRRLLDAYPQLAANGVFEGYVETLTSGLPWQRPRSAEEIIVNGRKRRIVVSRRASRVGGAVLASWERLDETISKDRRLARLEAFGGYGWAEWDHNTGEARWSPGMYRLFGKDASREPPALEALVDLVDAADRSKLQRFVADALSGRDCVADVRLAADEGRWLRLFCEAQAGESPHKVIQLLAQDVSERHANQQRLRSIQSRAAAGRLRLASQQDLTARLVQLLYPRETVSLATGAVTVTGRHYFGDVDQAMRADFCDAVELPGGMILLMVGDMFGAGMTAAATALRVVRPVIALGIAGVPLTRILTTLNTDLRRDDEPWLASLLLATFDPLTGDFRFGSAGHLPPIWLRSAPAGPRLLTGGAGPALGLIENPEYDEYKMGLTAGDAVVCYTDGVIDQRAADPLEALMESLHARYRADGARALLDASGPDHADEACIAILEVAGLNRT